MRKIKTEPTTEPISSTEAKVYLKVDNTDEDALIVQLEKAARKRAELYMNRQLVTATWETYLDEFPTRDEDWLVEVAPCPVIAVASVKYYDSDNVLQTLPTSVYLVDIASEPCRVSLAVGQSWPDTADRKNAVVIEYTAGYGAAASVPDLIKAGIYLLLGHLYETRQDVTKEKMNEIPMGSRSLFDMYRVY